MLEGDDLLASQSKLSATRRLLATCRRPRPTPARRALQRRRVQSPLSKEVLGERRAASLLVGHAGESFKPVLKAHSGLQNKREWLRRVYGDENTAFFDNCI